MNLHPVANLFPPMGDDDYKALVADIKENGQREFGWTFHGELIDGAHRMAACKELGLEFKAREWGGGGSGSLTAFVISLNLKRRHLTASQKAMVAKEALPLFESEAAARQKATLKQGAARPVKAILPEREKRQARDDAAAAVGVSPRYVQDAKKLAKEAPEKAEEVRAGKVTLSRALKTLRPKAISPAEEQMRRVRAGLARLKDWRAAYGDLPAFKALAAQIDQLTKEIAA